MSDLAALIERVRALKGPDREVDARIWAELRGRDVLVISGTMVGRRRCYPHDDFVMGRYDGIELFYVSPVIPPLTASIDAVVVMIKEMLPGWAWKVGTCSVSDDAWLVPDFNHPIHGERLRQEFGDFEAGSIWDTGVDIDQRPSGNVPKALLLAFLTAWQAREAA